MADPLSIAASVLALGHAGAGAARIARNLYSSFQDAPAELAVVSNKLLLIQAELEHIQRLSSSGYPVFLAAEAHQLLPSALKSTTSVLTDIEKAYHQLSRKNNVRSRLRWAVLDRAQADKLAARLRTTEDSLNTLVQLICLSVPPPCLFNETSYEAKRAYSRGNTAIIAELMEIKKMMETVAKDKTDSMPNLGCGRDQTTRMTTLKRERLNSQYHVLGALFNTLGISGSMVHVFGKTYNYYALSVRCNIPLPWLAASYELRAQLSPYTFPLGWGVHPLLWQSLFPKTHFL